LFDKKEATPANLPSFCGHLFSLLSLSRHLRMPQCQKPCFNSAHFGGDGLQQSDYLSS
jgi:hypothetical protein